MQNNPLVSFIISTNKINENFNNAINSLLDQDYANIEILIFFDLKHYDISKNKYYKFKNIKCYNGNLTGLPYALNYLIKQSKGSYIARMDADDLAHSSRVSKQIEFLMSNKNIDVVGSNANLFSNNNESTFIKNTNMDSSAKNLKFISSYKTPFVHPSIIAKRSFFIDSGGYDINFKKAQDFELFQRMRFKANYSNLVECLIDYRIKKRRLYSIVEYTYLKIKSSFKNNEYFAIILILFEFIYLCIKFFLKIK